MKDRDKAKKGPISAQKLINHGIESLEIKQKKKKN